MDCANKSSGLCKLALVVAWAFVAVPAAWGVGQTARKSMDLFRAVPATQPAPPATVPS